LTREAFSAVRRVLRPGGCLVINSFGELEVGHDFFAASLDKTLKAVFKGVRAHTAGNGAIFFVATDRPEPEIVRPLDLGNIHPEALKDTKDAFSGIVEIPHQNGRVLTDDRNPVEFYDAANRESIRRRLALAARKM
jgi:hypothetical protein